MKHTIKQELGGVLVFVAVLWICYAVAQVLPFDVNQFGVTPRTAKGVTGIIAMPFLHGSWGHLMSNTVPLTVLLMLMAGSRANSWVVVAELILAGGLILWVFGRNGTDSEVRVHVGASGLVYSLITYLLVAGFLERRFVPLAIAVLVGFLYGTTAIAGILPLGNRDVSWDGHLCGAVAGGLVAWLSLGRRSGIETGTKIGREA